MKGLDHLVLCVNDLDAAAKTYRDTGFTVTPRARHPFGTHNCIVQLDGFFLELLTVGEPEKIPAAQAGGFSFARFNQSYLAKREGCSMLVMDSSDFRGDNTAAHRSGIDTYEPFEFSRQAVLPSGDAVEVSFGLNFVSHQDMPMAGFFTCQQFQPQYFWNKEYQRHDNGAPGIVEVCLVAKDPARFEPFMSAFSHCRADTTASGDVQIPTARGRIAILTPQNFENRYQTAAPDMSQGPQLAGFTVAVKEQPSGPVSVFGAAILFEQV